MMGNQEKSKKQLIDELEQLQKVIAELQARKENEDAYRQVILQMPYQMEIFSPDGTSVLINQTMLKNQGDAKADRVIGKYNILNDPFIEEAGFTDYIEKVFHGETIYVPGVKVPLKQLEEVYGTNYAAIRSIYQNVILFPVFNDSGQVWRVVFMVINEYVHNVKENIYLAIKYFREHFDQEYSLREVAHIANLSPYYFIKVFREQTGKTPYEYLLEIKIENAKEMLRIQELSITDIGLACGFTSPSNFSSVFKKITGASPSNYRKTLIENS